MSDLSVLHRIWKTYKRFYYKTSYFYEMPRVIQLGTIPHEAGVTFESPIPLLLGAKTHLSKNKKRTFMNLAFLSSYPGCSLHKYLVKVLEFISLRLQCIPLNAKLLQIDLWTLSYILKKLLPNVGPAKERSGRGDLDKIQTFSKISWNSLRKSFKLPFFVR